MKLNRCINCMGETLTYPCPHCGFDPAKDKPVSYALTNTILGGRYLVGGIIGQGGFGITYAGLDLALQVKVAIKEFYPSGYVSRYATMGSNLIWNTGAQAQQFRENGLKSFLKEARKMAKVAHIKEVVGVRDLLQDNDTAYIIMDFIEGETLKKRLMQKGPMSWEEAKKIFFPAMEAMGQVHSMGMIHRDISPDNLMLEPGGTVRILDLGAAKDLSINSGASSMQVAKGGFSPLEQYIQRGNSGSWTDVYAMAATMYYTLTGVVPPSAVDRMSQDTLRWDLPQLQALPKSVLSAMRDALIVSPKDRTQKMETFLTALKSPVKREPVKPVSSAQSGGSSAQKQQSTPGSINNKKQAAPAHSGQQTASKQPKNRKPALAVALLAIVLIVFFTCLPECTFGHSWKAATCTAPKTCKTCGETSGLARNHDWSDATCTEASVCSRCQMTLGVATGHNWMEATCLTAETCLNCGETRGESLGHFWQDATFTKPRTCIYCGATSGEPLEASGYWGDAPENVGPASVYPYIMYETVYNCRSFTLNLEITSATGWYQGNWRLCLRDSNGNWQDVTSFVVEANSVGKELRYDFSFDKPITFDAVAVFPANLTGCSWSMIISLENIRTS